jgi:hypothetical protein
MEMSRLESLALRLVLLFGLAAGCADGPAAPGSPLPAGAPPSASAPSEGPAPRAAEPAASDMVGEVERNLARLRALEVVDVQRLVLDLPAEARQCYGAPCSYMDPAVTAEYRRQAPRLARLTELATRLAAAPGVAPAEPAGAEADLAALRKLEVVEIGRLVTVAPAPSPNCYNLPCPDDVKRAEAENQRRAGVAHALAVQSLAEKL